MSEIKSRNSLTYDESHKTINNKIYKLCSKHREFFPDEDEWLLCTEEYFYKNNKNSIDGLYPYCKKCASQNTMKNRKKNPENTKDSQFRYYRSDKYRISHRNTERRRRKKGENKKWQDINKDKIKQYNKNHRIHEISKKEWIANQEEFNNCCAYCGKTYKEQMEQNKEQFHREHVDYQGYNDVRNCVPACTQCNTGKRTASMKDWFTNQDFYTQDKYDKIIRWTTEGYKDIIEDRPPYRIARERNSDNQTYHYNLWSVDEKRNMVKNIATGDKKKDLDTYIKNYSLIINNT